MVLDNFIKIIGRILGSGRAWALQNETIRNILRSLLSINTETKEQFDRVLMQAFPDLCDDLIIPLWEEALGITPLIGQTIDERRSEVYSKWIAVGGQSKGYIQNILESVFSNIDVQEDLRLSTETDLIDYNFIQNNEIELFPITPWKKFGNSRIERERFPHSGIYSLKSTARTEEQSGPSQDITEFNINSEPLTINIWVYVKGDPLYFKIAIKNQYINKADEIIDLFTYENPTPNTWVNITGSGYGEWDGQILNTELFFYTDEKQTGGGYPDFYIDDLSISFVAFSDNLIYDGNIFSNGQLIYDSDTGETNDPVISPVSAKQMSRTFKILDQSGRPLVITYEQKKILENLLLTIKPAQKVVNERIAVVKTAGTIYFGWYGNPDAAGYGQFLNEDILDHNSLQILDHNSLSIQSTNYSEIDPDIGGKFTSNFQNNKRSS